MAESRYPQIEETVDQAGVLGSAEGVASAISHILQAAGALPSPLDSDFKNTALVKYGDARLWDATTPEDELLTPFTYVEPTVDLGNFLADNGKYLSRSDQLPLHRSHAVLNYAAQIFEKVYSGMGDVSLEDRQQVLLEDYARVLDLQDEASDKEGERQTALSVGPHLLILKGLLEQVGTTDTYLFQSTLADTASAIGIQYPLAQKLLRAISLEHKGLSETRRSLAVEKFTAGLMASGDVDSGMAMLLASKNEIGLSFWHKVVELTNEGERELALEMVTKASQYFPGVYKEATDIDASMGPMVSALAELGQDDHIVEIFQSLLGDEHVDFLPLWRFAYRCGADNDAHRVTDILDKLDLSVEQTQKIDDAFWLGYDSALKSN